MTTVEQVPELPRLPFPPGEQLFGTSPWFRELRLGGPVVRVRTPAGDEAWLVIGLTESKALYQDERVGRSHPEPEKAARISHAAIAGGPAGSYETERADHARMRRLLGPSFSARRMERLRVHVQELVAGLEDDLAARTPPADLHESLSFPLPVLVICELLGVPFEDREEFRGWSAGAADARDAKASRVALEQLYGYMHRLMSLKRREPGEDVMSDLVAAGPGEGMSDTAIAQLGAGLLFAGHETTVARIDLGTVLLLTHPEQLAALRRDPGLLAGAVEEILRYVVPSPLGLVPRYAHTDLTVAGTHIRAGEAVLLDFTAANRDPAAYPDPDAFDITRPPSAHITFGYGPYFCLGASLARVELQSVFSTIFDRLPTLQLAVPAGQLHLRDHSMTGGLSALPVTW
jgi:cytochrome P450